MSEFEVEIKEAWVYLQYFEKFKCDIPKMSGNPLPFKEFYNSNYINANLLFTRVTSWFKEKKFEESKGELNGFIACEQKNFKIMNYLIVKNNEVSKIMLKISYKLFYLINWFIEYFDSRF